MSNCQFCRRKIDEDKLMLHEMYCERNCIKCERCGYMYDQNDPESHEEEFHQLQQCPHCKEQFQDLKKHHCQEYPILCSYCKLEIPIKQFSLHEVQCGSRTEVCESCKQYVKMSEYSIHQQICQQKKFDKLGRGEKLDDFPSIQEVQKHSKPSTNDQVIQNKQEQQKQANNKIQTSQPIEFSNKYGKIDNPNKFQSNSQEKNLDYKQLSTDQNKGNKNYTYNNIQKLAPEQTYTKDQQKLQFEDPKYNQPAKLNQGVRSNQEGQDYKYQQDKYQQQYNKDEKSYYGNYNINQDSRQTQDQTQNNYKPNSRSTQNPYNVTPQSQNPYNVAPQSQNSYNAAPYPQNSYNAQQPYNPYKAPLSQNSYDAPQIKNSYDPKSKPPPNYNNEFKSYPYPPRDQQISQNLQEQNYYQNNDIKKPVKQSSYERINQDNQEKPISNQYKYQFEKNNNENPKTTKYGFQNQDDRSKKYDNEQQLNQQQRSNFNARNNKPTNNNQEESQKQNYYPSDKQGVQQQDNRKLPFQKDSETSKFQYNRNPRAYQDAKYEQQQPLQKQSEQQQQSRFQENQQNTNLDKQLSSYDQHIKKQNEYDYKPKQQNYEQHTQNTYLSKQNDYPNYQQSKINDNKSTTSTIKNNNLNSNDSVIAKNLYEQLLVEDLKISEEQMLEQKYLYEMMEENAKQKQQNVINSQKQHYQQTNQFPGGEQPNEFDFMTDEEILIQQQLLEKYEQQKKRK